MLVTWSAVNKPPSSGPITGYAVYADGKKVMSPILNYFPLVCLILGQQIAGENFIFRVNIENFLEGDNFFLTNHNWSYENNNSIRTLNLCESNTKENET